MLFLADDLGWANVGWHRLTPDDPGRREVRTPNMDQLVREGIELDQVYAYKFCAPSRSALQSGRLPTHVELSNQHMGMFNPSDPVSGFGGIPRNMTGMAQVLKAAGYATHHVGKWHAGFATQDHTPIGRGYDTSFGYFNAGNDYWTQHDFSWMGDADGGSSPFVDLWLDDGPAYELNGSRIDVTSQGVTGRLEDFEEHKFLTHVLSIIGSHDPSVPLFFNYCMHLAHEPLEVPAPYYEASVLVGDDFENYRRTYSAMVQFIDDAVGSVTSLLKQKQMYKDTLVLFLSDNGGPSFYGEGCAANNWPLRGGKLSNWQGGIRVAAFASGGWLQQHAPARAGARLDGLVSIADVYATVAALAGVDPTDHRAAAANLPPIDSLNLVPYLMGAADASPRSSIHLDLNAAVARLADGKLWKIIVGVEPQGCWSGPLSPNASSGEVGFGPRCIGGDVDCGAGCLFDLRGDPTERADVAANNPETLQEMQALLAEFNLHIFNPTRSGGDPNLAVRAAVSRGGYLGPWLP